MRTRHLIWEFVGGALLVIPAGTYGAVLASGSQGRTLLVAFGVPHHQRPDQILKVAAHRLEHVDTLALYKSYAETI